MIDDLFASFCLGTGTMTKCNTCQHQKNWKTLNQFPDALRKAMQSKMIKISTDECRLTSGSHFKPQR